MALNIVKHKNILIKILKDIYTDNTIGPFLGFKGGTAAYLFYDLPRFSTDLDFDLLSEEKTDYVFEIIKKIISGYGKVKKADKKRFNLFFLISYEEAANNIKIEINRRNFGSHYEVKTYLGISMKVMTTEDMATHKLIAMYERKGETNRDIFDSWFFLNNEWLTNKEIIKKRTDLSFDRFLQKCISIIEKKSNTGILAGIGELLDEKQKNWAKNNLRNDLLFLLKIRLENKKK
jgi:predicted nucleotidyltransferase component of viral defense system